MAVAVALLLGSCSLPRLQAPSAVTATITRAVLVRNTIPFGINLGVWSFWGAEQLMSNVLKNPGFEGLIDGAIAIPVHSAGGTFDDSPAWLARPNGFWEGAQYSLRTGPNAGARGRIEHSVSKNRFGLPSFTANGPSPLPGQAVSLVSVREDQPPAQWWFSKDPSGAFSAERRETRPGSPGIRSLRISSFSTTPATLASYLDRIGDRAGKLLPLTGAWNLSFWARLAKGSPSLRVVLGREGSRAVLNRPVELSSSWQEFRYTFEAGSDAGPPGGISLRFEVYGQPAGEVLLDDVDLHKVSDAAFPFRAEVVETLKTLHPAYLRDWQGQLGDTLANRIAPPLARRSSRYRPGGDDQSGFSYGLQEFLDLAARVEAAPWIVIPPIFTDEECAGLGTWLAMPGRLVQGREVLVEFGNENWNELFRPAGIMDPLVHGQAADRCLSAVRDHAPGVSLKTVVNAQFANARGPHSIGRTSAVADIVAIAPYYAYSMPSGLSLAKRNALLFEPLTTTLRRVAADVASLHKELAVYEVNLHTSAGTASAAERAPVVTGLASASSLARTLLDTLSQGVRRQCVYAFAGFDAGLESGKGFVPLWGIVRDLRAPGHFRPSGKVLRLLNDTVSGDMLQVETRGPADVSVYAFASRERISVVAVSAGPEPRKVQVAFPGPGRAPGMARMETLRTAPLSGDAGEVVSATSELPLRDSTAAFEIEPWSVVVLRAEGVLR